MTNSLLNEIEIWIEARGMSAVTFGRYAVNDGKFVGRLRAGKRIWPETEEKVRAYMADPSKKAGQCSAEPGSIAGAA